MSVIASLFITVEKSREITIEANFFNVLEEINSPANWQKWHSTLKKDYAKNPARYEVLKDSAAHEFSIKTPDHDFTIQTPNPLTFEIREDSGNSTSNYSIQILSTRLPHYTHLITTTRVSLLNFFLQQNNNAFTTAGDLKSFMQNPDSYYGYDIIKEKTIDTIVVVKKTVALKKNRHRELTSVYKSLASFIKANDLTIMQPKIASFRSISKDSVEIRAGIPVNRAVPGNENIMCLKMPKGFILVGQYSGPYNKRSTLKQAMEKYVQNHSLDVIALPYEKYLNDEVPKSDTDVVTIKMCYPIL